MAGVIALWAASHFAGVGEIADVALLIGGWLAIGAGAWTGCRKLLSFALTTRSARTEADLDRAAHDLAEAVTVPGIDVALGLLFRGRPKGTFSHSFKGPLPPMRQALKVMPRAGPPASVRVPDILHTRAGNWQGWNERAQCHPNRARLGARLGLAWRGGARRAQDGLP